MSQLASLAATTTVYDLGQPYYPGMPHFPTHPPFLFGMTKQHGEYVGPTGHSSASDALAGGCHAGTHMDALSHFSLDGKMFGGVEVETGMRSLGIDKVAPVVRRGVLLDIAGLEGAAALAEDFEITPMHLEEAGRGVRLEAGHVVLLRTGWGSLWSDAARFVNQGRGPGPSLEGARWLSARGVFAAGSDTLSFEKMPAVEMPAHVHLLVKSGIHIFECLNLEELARNGVREFLFIAAPLKIRGATAAPVRPLALV